MKTYINIYSSITDLPALFYAWKQFRKGKSNRNDVMQFEWKLERNIFDLHNDLHSQKYIHGKYFGFYITDPKQRHIHKAQVKDRIVHHAVFNVLNPIFEPTFISNSFSCRVGKGTHKGVRTVEEMIRKVSKNYTLPCFALKCDIKQFFNSLDHRILKRLLYRKIIDPQVQWILNSIIDSYISKDSNLFQRKGLPLGNLTSQLFANIYMNEFDQYVKHNLCVKYYARYSDDFIILSDSADMLKRLLPEIKCYLSKYLKLQLHPKKVIIRKFEQGIDFTGYVLFPHYRRLRTKTKKRMIKKLKKKADQMNNEQLSRDSFKQSIASYSGVLSHANTYKMTQDLKNQIWFWIKQDD